jgi:hypothetical protein
MNSSTEILSIPIILVFERHEVAPADTAYLIS